MTFCPFIFLFWIPILSSALRFSFPFLALFFAPFSPYLSPFFPFSPLFASFSPLARTCEYIMCPLSFPYDFFFKNIFYNISLNQLFSKNFIKKLKKSVWYIWSIIKNPLLLHPLSRTRAATKWHSEICGTNDSQFEIIFCLHSVRKVSLKVIFVKQRFAKNPEKEKWKKLRKNLEDMK